MCFRFSIHQTTSFILLAVFYRQKETQLADRYAFAFVMGGCRPEKSSYSDLDLGSHCQTTQKPGRHVVFIQMTAYRPYERLPENEENVTEALGI